MGNFIQDLNAFNHPLQKHPLHVCVQADRRAARAMLDSYCNKRGAYAALSYPKWDSSKQEVLAFFRIGQPSHLLAELGLHLGTCAGSQGMSERSWARLSRQCVPIRANLTADTKAKLMQLATNWSLLYPDVFLKWQKKKNLERESTEQTSSFYPGLQEGGTAAQPHLQTEMHRLRIRQIQMLRTMISTPLRAPLPIRIQTLAWHSLTMSELEKGRFEDRIITPIILLMDRILHELRLVVYPIM